MNAETDELNADALSLANHDLRGVASALALRAEVLSGVLSPRDLDAFKSLSKELLGIGNALQLLQGARFESAQAMGNRMGAEDWWGIASRLSANALPRGSRQTADVARVILELQEAALLTHAWRVACKGIAAAVEGRAVHIALKLAAHTEHTQRTFVLSACATSAAFSRDTQLSATALALSNSRWARYAKRRAKENRATLNWWSINDSSLVWSYEL